MARNMRLRRGPRAPLGADTPRLGIQGSRGDAAATPHLYWMRENPNPKPGSVLVAPVWTNGELWGGSDQRVYEELAIAIKQWKASGREVTLMSCHPTDDRPILLIRDMVGDAEIGYHAGYLDVTSALHQIASASVIVGERLHACVLAAAAGRPFVAIEYRPKVRDFAASVAMEGSVIRTDELKAGGLLELAEGSRQEPRTKCRPR